MNKINSTDRNPKDTPKNMSFADSSHIICIIYWVGVLSRPSLQDLHQNTTWFRRGDYPWTENVWPEGGLAKSPSPCDDE